MFIPSIVIPCGENRLDNLRLVLSHIAEQTVEPKEVIVVCDGFDPKIASTHTIKESSEILSKGIQVIFTHNPKHVPGSGTIQPKNAGAWKLDEIDSPSNAILFIDSDIILSPFAMKYYRQAWEHEPDRILIGPYEWLPENVRVPVEYLHNDPRGTFFEDYDYEYTSVGEINFALANFGGNILYPRKEFKAIGGFWDELSAGRVEDGEMGLRCCAVGIPMAAVPKARGWHLDHPVNHQWKINTNAEEVPKLNARHPWVENEGIFVSDNDGKRFEWIDPKTGIAHNTNEIWNYYDKNVTRNS